MYGLSPIVGTLDIIMGKLSKYTGHLPFGRDKQSSLDDTEGSHSEKKKYVGPYDNSPIPRVTIHSFIMGIFVSMYVLLPYYECVLRELLRGGCHENCE